MIRNSNSKGRRPRGVWGRGQSSPRAVRKWPPWRCKHYIGCITVILAVMMVERCQAENLISTLPGCFKSCSDHVGCRISANSCISDQTTAMDVAGSIRGLQADKRQDSNFQYVDLTWQPPADGSYKDLEGFQVNIQVYGVAPPKLGILGSWCFRFHLEANWTQSYVHHGSVHFFFRCLRLSKDANVNLHVTVLSLPLNAAVPKSARKEIEIHPMRGNVRWNPEFQRWADSNNALHVRIRNPLKAAALYQLLLRSASQGKMVFSQILPARHNAKTSNDFTTADVDDLPHFVIPGLNINDNYSIILHPLYQNQTHVLRSYVLTKVFSPNFTTSVASSSSSSKAVVTVTESDDDDDNNDDESTSGGQNQSHMDGALIALVLVTAVMLLLAFIILAICWRLNRRPQGGLAISCCCLSCRDPGGWDQYTGGRADSKILPIYCQESESYVKAVESHVSLLKHYVDIISVQERMSGSLGQRCPHVTSPLTWVYREVETRDAIIYLSPRLAKIARVSNVNDLEGVTDLDRYCHSALVSLGRKRKGRCKEPFSVHLVTFDCFQNAEERDCLRALGNLVDGLALVDQDRNLVSEPLKLASFTSGVPTLVNFELLLFRLCQLRDFPRELPLASEDWHETRDARETEIHLTRFALPCNTRDEDNSCLVVDLPDQTSSLEEGLDRGGRRGREECEGGGGGGGDYEMMRGGSAPASTRSVQCSDDDDRDHSDTGTFSVTSAVCKEPSFTIPNGGSVGGEKESKTARHQWTHTNGIYDRQRSERNSCTPAVEDDDVGGDNIAWNLGLVQGSIELTSFDSGYTSKPLGFFNLTSSDDVSRRHKRYPSYPGLTNGVCKESSPRMALKTANNNCPAAAVVGMDHHHLQCGEESDSDNNEYEGGTSGRLESDRLLCVAATVKDKGVGVSGGGGGGLVSSSSPANSPMLLIRKNGGTHIPASQPHHQHPHHQHHHHRPHHIVPPRFLPNLGTSSISDLIKGINDKTAWT